MVNKGRNEDVANTMAVGILCVFIGALSGIYTVEHNSTLQRGDTVILEVIALKAT